MDRWATFDCYGTLVDWNAGICGQLARIFGEGRADQLLLRYHELEPQVEAETPAARYREVMAEVMRRLGAPEDEQDALGRSLPDWPVFPEVPAALAEARRRGWRLAALSNTDRELIDASIRALGVPFDEAVVASEIGSYKPAHGHWEEFFRRTGADRAGHVHVAQSHFHDVVPANALGLRSIWINRLAERREPAPTRELPDLVRLPDTLDELVPA
ncbi:MAG TPA: HAD-IA family hydrolase [Gaiellaceae bacterium]|nr:HAD-IA family hydrolase [Gaiellaceae bacterium]